MIELKIFNEPTAERITEMIETIEDIRKGSFIIMTKNEFNNIIEEVEVLIECNKVMIDMINNHHDLDISKIREVLSANISWLEFNLDCLQTGAKKV